MGYSRFFLQKKVISLMLRRLSKLMQAAEQRDTENEDASAQGNLVTCGSFSFHVTSHQFSQCLCNSGLHAAAAKFGESCQGSRGEHRCKFKACGIHVLPVFLSEPCCSRVIV